MDWKIEIKNKRGVFDAVASGLKKDIRDLGIYGVKKVLHSSVYVISGNVFEREIKRIAKKLLADPVTQQYTISALDAPPHSRHTGKSNCRTVEIAYNPGVMDPVEESVKKAITDLGITGVRVVRTEKKYILYGRISKRQFNLICEKLLYNKVIQHIVNERETMSDSERPPEEYRFRLVTVDILKATDRKLNKISRDGQLFLNLREMKAIQSYFRRLRRNPTDCELETIAQTWSEHCAHKTFRGVIDYKETGEWTPAIGSRRINNLLKDTIMRATRELGRPWCVSVFEDNAGIIKFDRRNNICFKVETHNHPSALEPYGGAGTGIGGVIRDILGVGLGARPIMNTDVFCFGMPDTPYHRVPEGALHPLRVMKGVVSGVRDYGNRMGISTANGAVLFDERYTGNPLVYCGTVGIMPSEKSFKCPQKGDFIVVIGGRTGRDGIHGATFSSGELTHKSEEISGGAVQIGNPITEKKMADVLLRARDKGLYNAITDCGAGGFSSAVGEMGRELGAEVDLDKAPLKYAGLTYTEIWISEAQERMVLAVPGKGLQELLDIFRKEDVEAVVIGRFTGTGRLILRYEGNIVCDLDMEFLHEGIPRFERKAIWAPARHRDGGVECRRDLTGALIKILSSWNVRSKEWIIRQYDHEVQGQSVLKPLVGVCNDGPSDAAVIRPLFNSKKGLIVANGINPRYSLIDPYWMAASAIDEALRQVVSVGGSIENTAILDNFCWGNTDRPENLGALVRASFACYDIARGYGVPFISGKDSLNNEYSFHGRSVSILPTLLISSICVVDDIARTVSMDLKGEGNLLYVVGMTYEELGGSHYYMINGLVGNSVPKVDTDLGVKIFKRLHNAIKSGLVSSCHDCSEGGVGVALAEMAFSGGYGAEVFISGLPFGKRKGEGRIGPRDDVLLFSESNTRFIVEVKKRHKSSFEREMNGVPIGLIGCVSGRDIFRIYGLKGRPVVRTRLKELKSAWQTPLV